MCFGRRFRQKDDAIGSRDAAKARTSPLWVGVASCAAASSDMILQHALKNDFIHIEVLNLKALTEQVHLILGVIFATAKRLFISLCNLSTENIYQSRSHGLKFFNLV